MLLGELEPRSSTHSAFSELEFSNREISPMPLDRRVSFCGTAGPAVWFEELLKNLIRLSETDAMSNGLCSTTGAQRPVHNGPCTGSRHQPAILRRCGPRFSALFLNIDLPFQERALFNGDALRGHIARYHG